MAMAIAPIIVMVFCVVLILGVVAGAPTLQFCPFHALGYRE